MLRNWSPQRSVNSTPVYVLARLAQALPSLLSWQFITIITIIVVVMFGIFIRPRYRVQSMGLSLYN